jgi:hypothetical protein
MTEKSYNGKDFSPAESGIEMTGLKYEARLVAGFWLLVNR